MSQHYWDLNAKNRCSTSLISKTLLYYRLRAGTSLKNFFELCTNEKQYVSRLPNGRIVCQKCGIMAKKLIFWDFIAYDWHKKCLQKVSGTIKLIKYLTENFTETPQRLLKLLDILPIRIWLNTRIPLGEMQKIIQFNSREKINKTAGYYGQFFCLSNL